MSMGLALPYKDNELLFTELFSSLVKNPTALTKTTLTLMVWPPCPFAGFFFFFPIISKRIMAFPNVVNS